MISDIDYIADQLTNVWELSTPSEMFEHLQSQTNVNSKRLELLINEWYDNDTQRNEILMSMDSSKLINYINKRIKNDTVK